MMPTSRLLSCMVFVHFTKLRYERLSAKQLLEGPEARFSKLPVITSPVKLFCLLSQMGVSKVLKMVQ